jgi:universal stress protein E
MTGFSIRRILVASDLQPNTDAALRSAGELAVRFRAEVHVVHGLDIPLSGYPLFDTARGMERQLDGARAALRDQVESALPVGVAPASVEVRVESAPIAITGRASEIRADLIVLGPHRPRLFHGPILGTTVDRVIRSADAPVLILSDPLQLPLRRVLVPMDLSDPARGALDCGLTWARALGESGEPARPVEVGVLHVVPRLYEAYDFPFDRAVIEPELNREIGAARERVGGVEGVAVREEVVWGNVPAEEIVRAAQDGGAELLVMGTHGYGALGRALIGSITSAVARMAPCPMLLVPPPLWKVEETVPEITVEVEVAEPVL